MADGRSFEEILVESSGDADLVFLGIAEPSGEGEFPEYYTRLQQLANPLRRWCSRWQPRTFHSRTFWSSPT